MKKIVIAVAACALLAAGSASAQRGWRYERGSFWRGASENPTERIRFLQERIDSGIRDGSLDRREAERANRELNGVRDWLRNMHWRDEGRLTRAQRADVDARLERISSQIRWMKHN